MMRVKICGITNLEDALCADNAGADALGFIFYKKSPRCINARRAGAIIKRLSPFISCVGVFVNEKEREVKRAAEFCNLNLLQFHGDETPDYCARFRRYKTIKAVRIEKRSDLFNIKRYNTNAVLLDTFCKGAFGGTGRVFDWNFLGKIKFDIPIILSGGITLQNAPLAIKLTKCYAVDASSGLEEYPGKKNHKLIKEFVRFFKNN
ncbi:MAG: phosphoribosylanthranilate isomerase [Candidatus Omnitrophica bacterium CG11_big_fil_rev_8_21_14_0_20_42_13]|uniref:N-(5'-phosphoribosyl)anthranilate isomerase n=1 Tax=Candidatus Ghiorseimicrobium undicola TaxID=1974746 RepID=A0A2H0LWQ4_9BACT|nr:MAG: phosphoribosylanthranilate isomerase [Candidatus Omnitrophica bacterium CG11_big_fil_rev_8_21_14_0_20_42_13]